MAFRPLIRSTKATLQTTCQHASVKGIANHSSVAHAIAGNGSQWPRMGADLLAESAAFRGGVSACAAALKPHGLDLMAAYGREDGFSDPVMAAVSLIAVQVSARLGNAAPPLFPSQGAITRIHATLVMCSRFFLGQHTGGNCVSLLGQCRWA